MSSARSRATRATSVAIVTLLFAAALVPMGPTSPAAAQDSAQCAVDEELRLLMLFDVSGSLGWTDPDAGRREGGLAALGDLLRLQRRYADVELVVAVDSFATVYDAGDWVSLASDSTAAAQLEARIDAVGSQEHGGLTDYREALSGALERMSAVRSEVCKRVVWFTDGTHDTDRRSGPAVTAAESDQIDELCMTDGAAARLAAAKVEVTAVNLSASPAAPVPETLRRLYDQGDNPCENPLLGEIIRVDEVGELAKQLRESIADDAFEAIEKIPPSRSCGISRESLGSLPGALCEFTFELDLSTQSFEIFMDLKALDDPNAVEVLLRRPTDEQLLPIDFPDDEAMHRPTGFLALSGTSNWKKLRGHQAAAFSSRLTSDSWAWEGTWGIVFHGDGSSLARVTPPVITTKGLPELGPILLAVSRLEGQVSLPPASGPFQGQVRLAVAAPGNDLDGWRIGPIDGYEVTDLQWRAGNILGLLVSEPGMEQLLRSNDGTVDIIAQLVQVVDWGSETGIKWEVPNAKPVITVPVAAAAWEAGVLHPSVASVAIAEGQELTPAGSLHVVATAGARDGRLTLDSIAATANGERVPLTPSSDWECVVAASPSVSDLDCPTVHVEAQIGRDVVADFELRFTSTLDEAGRLRSEAISQGFDDEAAKYDPIARFPVRLEGVDIRVASTGETWRWFLGLFLIVIVVAAAARWLTARDLRKWVGLNNDQAFEAPVRLRDGTLIRADDSPVVPPAEMSFVSKLTQAEARATVGPITLRSRLWRPLLGWSTGITASRRSGECISKGGRTRQGKGIVGSSLSKGWALSKLHVSDTEATLVVWDLPRDPQEASHLIEEAVERAASACTRSGFLHDHSPESSSAAPEEADEHRGSKPTSDAKPPGLGLPDASDPRHELLDAPATEQRDPLNGRDDPLA